MRLSRFVRFALVSLPFSACAALAPVTPAAEVEVAALSSTKNPSLARSAATARAGMYVAQLEAGVGFVLDRSKQKPVLKLSRANGAPVADARFESREPSGIVARVTLKRSPERLASLSRMDAVHVSAEAFGADADKTQLKAEADAFRDAILRFAEARGKKDSVLRGRLTIINHRVGWEGRQVTIAADLSVDFVEPKPAPPPPPPKKPRIGADGEPIDDGIPRAEDLPPIPLPASAPAEEQVEEMVFE